MVFAGRRDSCSIFVFYEPGVSDAAGHGCFSRGRSNAVSPSRSDSVGGGSLYDQTGVSGSRPICVTNCASTNHGTSFSLVECISPRGRCVIFLSRPVSCSIYTFCEPGADGTPCRSRGLDAVFLSHRIYNKICASIRPCTIETPGGGRSRI